METYEQMTTRHQNAVSSLPLIFAFSDQQLDEALAKRGMVRDDLKHNKLVSLGSGTFCLQSDKASVLDALAASSTEVDEAMKDYDFACGAFLYEMGNHEYHINRQADWDTFSCFGNVEYGEDKEAGAYMDELGFCSETKAAFYRARTEFFRQCDENGWW